MDNSERKYELHQISIHLANTMDALIHAEHQLREANCNREANTLYSICDRLYRLQIAVKKKHDTLA